MTDSGQFENFDQKPCYYQALADAKKADALNFVVQFGKEEAQVAFDLTPAQFTTLLSEPADEKRPVRWINIWAPDKQAGIMKQLGELYHFSPRLLAIMLDKPSPSERVQQRTRGFRHRKERRSTEVNTELREVVVLRPDDNRGSARQDTARRGITHYTLAEKWINYQSFDQGSRYLCIGANWLHRIDKDSDGTEVTVEGEQRRLWSWLVLCNDNTVISLHENPGEIGKEGDIKSIRANTLSVLSQLSELGHASADPMSMQTVRQALQHDVDESDMGLKGASLLFYYLFDDWRAVFHTVDMYDKRLTDLRAMILAENGRKSLMVPRNEIIPRLHILGGQLRQSQHLYEGYKNLIERVLRAVQQKPNGGLSTPRSMSTVGPIAAPQVHRGATLTQSAIYRFERLSDRLELLILSKTKEFSDEKAALISTYFNINAQKDTEATARLTRSATLLAKLSVLFLPVSLMTSYFSVQISDLNGVYTSKDYWYSFAILMSISFLFLFFFSRLLMWLSEFLDMRVKTTYIACVKYFSRLRKPAEEKEE